MVQSINLKAITTLASVVRRPYLAAPHVFVPTVSGKWLELHDVGSDKSILFDSKIVHILSICAIIQT